MAKEELKAYFHSLPSAKLGLLLYHHFSWYDAEGVNPDLVKGIIELIVEELVDRKELPPFTVEMDQTSLENYIMENTFGEECIDKIGDFEISFTDEEDKSLEDPAKQVRSCPYCDQDLPFDETVCCPKCRQTSSPI